MPIRESIERLSRGLKNAKINVPEKLIRRDQSYVEPKQFSIPELVPQYQNQEKLQYHYLTEFLTMLSKYGNNKPIHVLTADYPQELL